VNLVNRIDNSHQKEDIDSRVSGDTVQFGRCVPIFQRSLMAEPSENKCQFCCLKIKRIK
jgi:hypothetical protein